MQTPTNKNYLFRSNSFMLLVTALLKMIIRNKDNVAKTLELLEQ